MKTIPYGYMINSKSCRNRFIRIDEQLSDPPGKTGMSKIWASSMMTRHGKRASEPGLGTDFFTCAGSRASRNAVSITKGYLLSSSTLRSSSRDTFILLLRQSSCVSLYLPYSAIEHLLTVIQVLQEYFSIHHLLHSVQQCWLCCLFFFLFYSCSAFQLTITYLRTLLSHSSKF